MLPFTGVEADMGIFASEDNLEISSMFLVRYLLKYPWDCHGILWAKRPCAWAVGRKGANQLALFNIGKS